MSERSNLIIFGASARAAAFSALRAGLQPWCADLFADADLQARCPALRLPAHEYPNGFLELLTYAPPGPWMYTGALENRPRVVERITRRRRLWGNAGSPARSHELVAWTLERGGIPCPRVQLNPPADSDAEGWLVKPYAGAGGAGIQFCEPGQRRPARLLQVYFQEFIAGDTCAAIYVGEAGQALLLGVTGQRVGADWLHAAPFHYCGSIGPLSPAPALGEALQRLGNALASTFGLRGLFGVDCVLRDGVPYPVEVNPRYTASVEVLEYATGLSTLALHCAVFDPSALRPSLALRASGENNTMVGKAILFARESLTFPADGPWLATLRQPPDIWEMPAFADIPHPGEPIPVGRPVITFFARGDSPTACRDTLQQIAADLDRWLFGA